MASTKPTVKRANSHDQKVLQVTRRPDQTHSEKLASLVTDGTFTAATLHTYANAGSELDVTDLVAAMRKAGDDAVAGKLDRYERVLAHQFLTLDAVFNNLAQRSWRQESFKGIETLMRLALKAQAQARATAETLALMKNPMPYIKQANIAHGPQQVNNGTHASAGGKQNPPNELLEQQHGNHLDGRTKTETSRADSQVQAMGKKHRATQRRG